MEHNHCGPVLHQYATSRSLPEPVLDKYWTSMGPVRTCIGQYRQVLGQYETSMGEYSSSMGPVQEQHGTSAGLSVSLHCP